MVVVVAETDEDDSHTSRASDEVRSLQDRFVRAWVQAVRTREPKAPVAGFSQEVVALLPAPCGGEGEHDTVMRSVGEMVKIVRGDGGGGRRSFSTGVSRPVESVADIPRAYAEALRAVAVGRQMQGESAVMHFDGLGIYRLLSLIPDTADLRAFVDEALGELATDEQASYADLRQTLQVLLDTNLNVAETARLLFFHYNTLRYRIAKLEQMLGPVHDRPAAAAHAGAGPADPPDARRLTPEPRSPVGGSRSGTRGRTRPVLARVARSRPSRRQGGGQGRGGGQSVMPRPRRPISLSCSGWNRPSHSRS